MSHNYKLHLPNGDIHEIDYELEVNQSNSFDIFLQKLEIQDPKLRLFVSKGQLMESDSSEITPDSFPFLDNATDMYLILPDVESMFKLAKYKVFQQVQNIAFCLFQTCWHTLYSFKL